MIRICHFKGGIGDSEYLTGRGLLFRAYGVYRRHSRPTLEAKKYNGSNRFFRIAKNKEGARPEPVERAFYGDTQTMVELERQPDRSVAAELAAKGRAIKQANRAHSQQVEFRELKGGEDDIPF